MDAIKCHCLTINDNGNSIKDRFHIDEVILFQCHQSWETLERKAMLGIAPAVVYLNTSDLSRTCIFNRLKI